MRCADASRQLQLYIDHRLTFEQMRILEAHIATCAVCQRELLVLEEVSTSFHMLVSVAEPEDLTMRIMQQVAITPQYKRRKIPYTRKKERVFSLLRPSLPELIAIVLLATITTLGILWQQPAIRSTLPLANEHDPISLAILNMLHLLNIYGNSNTLLLLIWVVGAFLGVFITFVLAGNELRSHWFKAMMDRLPVR
jgi:predicted anti-sigma-YlaC factor YlaD